MFHLDILGLMFLGVIIGTVNGITPGLGVNIGLALAIPFVFGVDPFVGLVFLLSLHSVGMTGGSITSIMLSVPGTGPNTATIVDGYPMAQKGEGGRAVGAALAASGAGGIIGAMILAALIPALRPIVMAMGSGEIFMLIVFGLTFIASLSGRSLIKGVISAALGLALSMVGLSPYSGTGRFIFGQMWLWDGIHIVTLVVGLFAVSEMIRMGARGSTIALADAIDIKEACSYGKVLQGVKDTFHHWWLMLRGAVIGAVTGIIPGLGGDVAVWIAYGHAAQTSRNNENFGKGDVRGVIAPEAANNAKEGGALLPTVAFGLPGSSGMAILLGAFLILGITPGPQMLTKHLDLVWSMVWILVMANILAVLLLFASAKFVAKVAYVRPSIIIPFVMMLAMLGSVLASGRWQNLMLAAFMGIIGYWLRKAEYPLAALVLGFVLGGLAEKNLHQAVGAWGIAFLLRPWTLVLLVMVILSISYFAFLGYREKKKRKAAES